MPAWLSIVGTVAEIIGHAAGMLAKTRSCGDDETNPLYDLYWTLNHPSNPGVNSLMVQNQTRDTMDIQVCQSVKVPGSNDQLFYNEPIRLLPHGNGKPGIIPSSLYEDSTISIQNVSAAKEMLEDFRDVVAEVENPTDPEGLSAATTFTFARMAVGVMAPLVTGVAIGIWQNTETQSFYVKYTRDQPVEAQLHIKIHDQDVKLEVNVRPGKKAEYAISATEDRYPLPNGFNWMADGVVDGLEVTMYPVAASAK